MNKLLKDLIGVSLNALMIASMYLMFNGYPIFDKVLNVMNTLLVIGECFVILVLVSAFHVAINKVTDQYDRIRFLLVS